MNPLSHIIRNLFIGALITAIPCGFIWADALETAATTPPSVTVIHQGHYEPSVSIPPMAAALLTRVASEGKVMRLPPVLPRHGH